MILPLKSARRPGRAIGPTSRRAEAITLSADAHPAARTRRRVRRRSLRARGRAGPLRAGGAPCNDPVVRRFSSHGDGAFTRDALGACGEHVIFEAEVRIWHPEHVFLGENVYLGHGAMLKAYYKNELRIDDDTWVGQGVFFHAAGGIHIGPRVGIGPFVKILTSVHDEAGREVPILASPLRFAPVVIEADADVGVSTIILPGVRIGQGAQVGAGSVVTRDVPPYAVVAGNPARVLRFRPE